MAKPSEAPSTPILAGMPDPESALREIQNADVSEDAPGVPNPRSAEEFSFTVDHTDGAGNRRKGEFKNRILTIEQRLNTSLLQAKLTRNTPWEAIDPEGQYLTTVIAHLTASLVEKPSWFSVSKMRDVALLNKVYAEVAEHEAYFRGDRKAEGSGA
jgi:hypothetical protein